MKLGSMGSRGGFGSSGILGRVSKAVPGVLRGGISGFTSLAGALSLGFAGTLNASTALTGAMSADASFAGTINGTSTLSGALAGASYTPTYYVLGF